MAGQIVWAVFEQWEWESKELMGVFSTLEKAEDYADALSDDNDDSYYLGRVSYQVVPVTLDDKVRP